ncbi:class I SAM-dependent methyltransferase [Aurantibacillus circumpalustris]|uniref:class I SAM-dependent methyltransferase n=1 Tax=Aurantibacillus circumpalustris TaxID=3036359 RepID=UPI00295C2158|nr:class I SAM-dependent methyltransferase [Aurantibacillus circumpalustris]
MIENTLIKNASVEEVESLNVQKIIKGYKDKYNIEVSYLFEKTNEVKIVKCSKTGFRFYYPLSVEGDNKFYIDLYSNNTKRLYQKVKWEFKQAASIIKNDSLLIDVGCGGGDFFDELAGKNCKCYGLDKSDFAGDLLKSKGVEFSNESIEIFAEKNLEKFDYVTGFQILEHVKHPGKFISSMTKMLKKGGLLIIAVPNNEPYFLKYDKYHTLNLPPHHMGLWNKESLTNIAPHFGLRVKDFKYEGFDYLIQYFKNKTGINNKISTAVLKFFLKFFNNTLGKRTALVVYEKI